MHEVAISIDSVSSAVRVPSLRDVERKSIMARARRFLESRVDAYRGYLFSDSLIGGGGRANTIMAWTMRSVLRSVYPNPSMLVGETKAMH